jgi:hypothetical protein
MGAGTDPGDVPFPIPSRPGEFHPEALTDSVFESPTHTARATHCRLARPIRTIEFISVARGPLRSRCGSFSPRPLRRLLCDFNVVSYFHEDVLGRIAPARTDQESRTSFPDPTARQMSNLAINYSSGSFPHW